MDKLFKSNWFVKIVSFLLALMLYTVVSADQQSDPPNQPSPFSGKDQSVTLTQDLKVNVDQDKYIVTGVPETVKVDIKGSSELILKAKLLKSTSAFINLKNKPPGDYTVKVQTDGFPDDIKVSPIPSEITVTLQKRVTDSMPISIDLLNETKIDSGYIIGEPETDPKTVDVTGGKEAVNAISFIKGVVDVKGANATVEKQAKLNAYDSDGNQLNVAIDPAYVNVKVPVTKATKKVPVKVDTKGKPADGVKIESVDISPEEVTLFGQPSTLDNISEISGLTVSVDGLKDDKTFKVDVPVPDGVKMLDPKTITVKVKVSKKESSNKTATDGSDGKTDKSTDDSSTDTAKVPPSDNAANDDNSSVDSTKETTKQFKNVPVDVQGLDSDKQSLTFIHPTSKTVDVNLTGNQNDMQGIKASDIGATIDVSGLNNGEHELPIQLELPNGVKGREKLVATIQLADAASNDTTT